MVDWPSPQPSPAGDFCVTLRLIGEWGIQGGAGNWRFSLTLTLSRWERGFCKGLRGERGQWKRTGAYRYSSGAGMSRWFVVSATSPRDCNDVAPKRNLSSAPNTTGEGATRPATAM